MKASQIFIHTLREDPSDAQVVSHKLMLRAGLAFKQGSGLYTLMPLGLKVIRKIENIVREEMNKSKAIEFQVPILTTSELWEKSGRWQVMGRELFRVEDRHKTWNALGPTHEESFTDLISQLINSYKELPINVYQIHTKFRDEIRPRFGMIRAREFVMKDAYSFHVDEKSLDETYQEMRNCYRNIFRRVGLETIPVLADSGSMGGSASEEFMVASGIGEEVLLLSEDYSYSSNREKTPVYYPELADKKNKLTEKKNYSKLEKVHTPNINSIEDLALFFKCNKDELLKAVFYLADNIPILIFIRGDREINEVKLANLLKSNDLIKGSLSDAKKYNLITGFIGPEGLEDVDEDEGDKNKIKVLWDLSVKTRKSWTTGANEIDYHYKNFTLKDNKNYIDLALAIAGDLVPNSNEKLIEKRGIEVGHIFKLGYKYTNAFGTKVLDKDGKTITPIMGCYGIGINRTMATVIEQSNDEKGIIFPLSVAPFEIVLIGVTKDKTEYQKVEEIYNLLLVSGFDILWDDRELRPGVKFSDAELIGFPIRITLGKNYFNDGVVEVVLRKDLNNKITKNINNDLKNLVSFINEIRNNY